MVIAPATAGLQQAILQISSIVSSAGFQKAFEYMGLFREGLICTLSVSALTVLFGFILALILALMRLSKFRVLRAIVIAYVEFFRGTPLLVQVWLVFYVLFPIIEIFIPLPQFMLFGFIRFERFIPCVFALSLNSGAYLSETIRSGIQSIDGGQTEAARSLGLTQVQNMRYIVLPQAIKNTLPAIANEFVTIIKESSICYTIGVGEIMFAVNAVRGATFKVAEALIIATILYFCLTFTTSKIIAYFERRMSRGDRR